MYQVNRNTLKVEMTPQDNLWKASLIFSLLLHVSVLLMTIFGPKFFHRRPIMPEVYTVNLFTASAPSVAPAAKPAAAKKPAAPKPPPAAPPPEPVKSEPVKPEAVQIEPVKVEPAPPKPVEPEPVVKVPPKKAISLKPDKAQKKLKDDKEKKIRDDLIKARALAKVRAKLEVEKAKQAADLAAKNAVERLRESLLSQADRARTTDATEETPSDEAQQESGGSSGAEIDSALKRYFAEVALRINGNWSLPDIQNLPESIEAILMIKVTKDGVVVGNYFDPKSDNPIYDSAVMRALQKSLPLPPFPPELKEKSLEFGFRFRPGGVQ